MNSCRPSRCLPSGPAHEIPSKKHPSRPAKSSAYKWPTRFLAGWRNSIENGASVTKRHLFWPNQRRKAASLLPIWLRNYGIFGCRNSQDATRGGRGGSAGRKRQDRLIHMLAWNFIANGSPALFCGKNHSAGPRRQRPMPTSAGR